MTDPIKYIVAYHVDTVWQECDHFYIAKQGSNGPIDLTEDEVRAVVRQLNVGGLAEFDPYALYINFDPFNPWQEHWQGPCCHGGPDRMHNCADAYSYWVKLDGECKTITLKSEIGL